MDNADFRRARPEYRKPKPGTIINTIHDEMAIYEMSPVSKSKEEKKFFLLEFLENTREKILLVDRLLTLAMADCRISVASFC